MLKISIPDNEIWDEANQEFITIRGCELSLEHSLVSISKWEQKWCKAFLGKNEKTKEETIDYVRCMTLTPNVDPNVYIGLSRDIVKQINDYITAPMTATVFSEQKTSGGNREVLTSEVIYCNMILLNVPFECQKWHLNRLLTLLKVCDIKSQPPKKMGKRELMNRNAALNAARRKQFGTKG